MNRKKQPPRNAYYFFMMEFKEKEQKRGKNYGSMKDVASAAAPLWAKLSKAQKEPYEKQAKEQKGTTKKYTSQGVDIEIIKREEERKTRRIDDMHNDIEEIVDTAAKCKTLPYLQFHVMHVNEFCYCNSTGRYSLAELAICRFSLLEGVRMPEDVYHIIVKPGPLPLGYKYQAKKMSEDCHQLPYPDDDDEDNMDQVVYEMMEFLSKGKQSLNDPLPPIYVLEEHESKIRNVLEGFCTDYNLDEGTFKVYDLTYLYYKLLTVDNDAAVPFMTIARMQMDADVYDYAKGIACEFHVMTDSINHCSRSHVIRRTFQICNFCCERLKIKMVPGQHVPFESDMRHLAHKQLEQIPGGVLLTQAKDDDQYSVASTSSTVYSLEEKFKASTLEDGKNGVKGRGLRPSDFAVMSSTSSSTGSDIEGAVGGDVGWAAAKKRLEGYDPRKDTFFKPIAVTNSNPWMGDWPSQDEGLSQTSQASELSSTDFPSLGAGSARRSNRPRGKGVASAWSKRT